MRRNPTHSDEEQVEQTQVRRVVSGLHLVPRVIDHPSGIYTRPDVSEDPLLRTIID